MNSSILECC